MKFNKKLSELYSIVLEQNVPPTDPESLTADNANPSNTPSSEDATQPQPESNVEKMTPEGEVTLIRLIRKALTTKVKPEDLTEIAGLDEINEKNAQEMLKKLLEIIRRYSETDIA